MGLNDQNRKDLVELYWSKSMQTMEEAEVAVAAQKWSMAANRIYYALFHAVTALFVNDGYKVGTHRGAKASFGEHYIITGKLEPQYGRLFAQLETMRDKADYDIIYNATQEEVLSFLPKVKDFLEKIHCLLTESDK